MTSPSDRQRQPQPVLKRRLPSGRGAIEQPNASHDGDATLTARFWLGVITTGAAAGLIGAALMWLLFTVEHLAFGFHHGGLESAIRHTSDTRRMIVLVCAGLIGGSGWWLIRRSMPGRSAEIDDAIWTGHGELSVHRSVATSLLSEVVVGMGASIGREAAPKLLGGTSGGIVSRLLALSPAQRRLLVACGAGAGLAGVYNVPIGGAIFTAEVLLGSVTLATVLPALVCSAVATVSAWCYLPEHPIYSGVPTAAMSLRLVVWAVVFGPLIGGLAVIFVRLIGWVSHHRARGASMLIAQPVAFAGLAVLGFGLPQLFGNGLDMAQSALLGGGSLALLIGLTLLKPLVTSACLGAGASGGLLTPVLSTGAALGAASGVAWSHLWPGTPVGAYALMGAAALVAAAMQAPLSALVLVLELTGTGSELAVPLALATALSTLVARQLDGYSIYSARLPAASS